jgi:hypothetical protein
MKKRLFTLTVCCLFLSFLSCEDENEADNIKNAIAGTWQLTSVKIDGTEAATSSFPDVIQFQPNFIFQSYNTSTQIKVRGGWSYEGDMLNISVDLPASYYVLNANAQNLSLKRLDFNTGGDISTTILEYRNTSDLEIP